MIKALKHLNLTNKEIELYLLLDKLGEISVSYVSNKLNIRHSSASYLCTSICNKGVAFKTTRSGGAFYKAKTPESVIHILKTRSDEAKSELIEHRLKHKEIPHILAASNEKEVLDLYKKFWQLTPEGTIVYSHTKLLPPELSAFSDEIWHSSIKIRKQRNIHLNMLCEYSDLAKKLQSADKIHNRKTIILEKDDLNIAPFEIIAHEGLVMELLSKENGHLAIFSNSQTFATAAHKRLKMLWDFHEDTES